MEFQSRRSRRGRGRHNQVLPQVHDYTPPQACKPWSFLSGVYSLLIMSSMSVLIYMMLDYHCETCRTHSNINDITKNIDNIAKNLSTIKDNYYDLETKISKLSRDLPKIEGQVEVLEALTHSIEKRHAVDQLTSFCHMENERNNSMDDVLIPKVISVGSD
ncbi:uncharacterized protein LOC106141034 [Amyelois transitella]|uniref:uncharacterized protein LOC106141034 n=1 Tax=Amyelois transitella TaxID=680683 RepID=UPI00067D14B5|nr:uncharacterized protein LOC106141034 [Amyelois transitella]